MSKVILPTTRAVAPTVDPLLATLQLPVKGVVRDASRAYRADMAKHTVQVQLDVEVVKPGALAALGGGSGSSERGQVEAAVTLGLRELAPIAERYGFRISNPVSTVDDA